MSILLRHPQNEASPLTGECYHACRKSPCMSFFPEVVTYEKIRLRAGHFRRVLQVAWQNYLVKGIGKTALSRLKRLDDQAAIDDLNEQPLNCAFLSPLISFKFDLLTYENCGIRLNGQTCCGDIEDGDPKLNLLIKLINEQENEISRLNAKIDQLKQNVLETKEELVTQAGELQRKNSFISELEGEIQKLQDVLNDRVNELNALKAINESGGGFPTSGVDSEGNPIFDKNNLSFIREGLTAEQVLDALKELERIEKIRNESVLMGTQSKESHIFDEFDLELSHGVDGEVVLPNEKKEVRLRVDYQMKCILLSRNSRTRLIPIASIICLFSTPEHLNGLKEKGYLTTYQTMNPNNRIALFGIQIPFVLEFESSELKNRFYRDVNILIDSIQVEIEKISNAQTQEERRYELIQEIMINGPKIVDQNAVPQGFQNLIESPVSSENEA